MNVFATLPGPAGEQLWLVHLKGSRYDNDPRDSGIVPVNGRFWVIAQTYDEARRKAQPRVDQLIRSHGLKADDTEVSAQPFPLEALLPARSTRHDGRLGFYASHDIAKVELSLPEDQSRYRLAVCLVEVDQTD